MTNCEFCCVEIEDEQVQQCDACKQDGMCDECLMNHGCPGFNEFQAEE